MRIRIAGLSAAGLSAAVMTVTVMTAAPASGRPPAAPAGTPAAAPPGSATPHDLGYQIWPQPYGKYALSRAVGQLSVYSARDRSRFPCTASVIESASRSLVLTAAHCVREIGPKGLPFTRMRFVPAYSAGVDRRTGRAVAGTAPYGVWTVRRAWAARAWKRSRAAFGDPYRPNRFTKDDVAVVSVAPDRSGRRIEDVVGGFRPVVSGPHTVAPFTTLGYPFAAESGLSGNLLYGCGGTAAAASSSFAPGAYYTADCWVRLGHSGGPWISTGGHASVFAVTSAAMMRPGSLAAPLRPATFGAVYAAADRWSMRRPRGPGSPPPHRPSRPGHGAAHGRARSMPVANTS